jgi:deoxyribodipyrimidine photolyase-related protein
MRTVWILGDQLTLEHSALADADRACDRVLLIESRKRGAHLRYHKIKLAMVFAAMRHFAEELRGGGWNVDYHHLPETEDFRAGLSAHLAAHACGRHWHRSARPPAITTSKGS